jgi:hypothetical protein
MMAQLQGWQMVVWQRKVVCAAIVQAEVVAGVGDGEIDGQADSVKCTVNKDEAKQMRT